MIFFPSKLKKLNQIGSKLTKFNVRSTRVSESGGQPPETLWISDPFTLLFGFVEKGSKKGKRKEIKITLSFTCHICNVYNFL